MRRSRHHKHDVSPTSDIRITQRCLASLVLFNRYRILPLNWMHALADTGDYAGYRDVCTRLWRAGLLDRKTHNGALNNNETQSYMRTDAGTRYLRKLGVEPLANTTHHDAHQALVDISEAHIELGARAHDVEYHPWIDIRDHPLTPKLPAKPFRFGISETFIIPDGRPFYLKNALGQSALCVREIDRNTEDPATIQFKLKHYKLIHDLMKQRYGFKQVFLLFITTNETRHQNVLKWISEIFPSGCKWILTGAMHDHVKHGLSTLPVSTDLFTDHYSRAGYPSFSLLTLRDVQ